MTVVDGLRPVRSEHTRLVLLLILQEPERVWYGWEIISRLRMLSGTVYPILHRLANAGWLTSYLEPAEVARFSGRRRRRFYRLTEDGRVAAGEALSSSLTPLFLTLAEAVDLPIDVTCSVS